MLFLPIPQMLTFVYEINFVTIIVFDFMVNALISVISFRTLLEGTLTRKNPLWTDLFAVHYVSCLEACKIMALAGRGSLFFSFETSTTGITTYTWKSLCVYNTILSKTPCALQKILCNNFILLKRKDFYCHVFVIHIYTKQSFLIHISSHNYTVGSFGGLVCGSFFL